MELKPELGQNVGEFDPESGLREDPIYCAFSGKFVRGVHSNRERISGTPFFYRILADELHKVTDAWRVAFADAVKAKFRQSGEPAPVAPKAKSKADKPEEN